MAEASDSYEIFDGDHRNRRKQGFSGKVGNNYKEKQKRMRAKEKRLPKEDDVKAEYDEINEEYQKKLRKQKKAEAAMKINQDRKDNFEKDFRDLALGPEHHHQTDQYLQH